MTEPHHYFSTKAARLSTKLEEAEKTIEELLIALDRVVKYGPQDTESHYNAVSLLKKHGKI